jgi:3-oxoacyl-[acyl-carrier protein] reductase
MRTNDKLASIMSKLSGKVAIVTGASKGIGAGIAKALAAEGAAVVVNYASSKQGADQVVDAISKAGGEAFAIGADVSKASEAQALVESAVRHFGRLDILVNNSGIFRFAPLEGTTEQDFHDHFNVNVLGPLLTSQAALKYLGHGSSIINVGSLVTRLSPPASVVYTATKGALDAITGVLARELGPKQIRVNSINPGMVVTEGTISGGYVGSDMEKDIVGRTPLGRVGQPDDIAAVAVFLASDDSRWITGEVLGVGGGLR